jgi:branched-chain amino acid transport system permease protein
MPAFFNDNGFLILLMVQQALLALSLYLPLTAGQLSLATPGFYALGGYVAAVFSTRIFPPSEGLLSINILLFEMFVAGVLCAIAAVFVGVPALRLRGVYFSLATIAFVEVLRVVSLNLEITGGAVGIFAIPQVFETQLGYLWVLFPLLCVVCGILFFVENLRPGRALRAIREDELAAGAMGINVLAYKSATFIWGAVLAGVVGAVSAHLLNTWNSRQGTFDASVNCLAYVLIGGSYHLLGPVVGGAILSVLPELLKELQDFRLFINGLLLVLAALFLPQGMIGRAFLKRAK